MAFQINIDCSLKSHMGLAIFVFQKCGGGFKQNFFCRTNIAKPMRHFREQSRRIRVSLYDYSLLPYMGSL